MPLTSIILPTYNRADLLVDALRSVQAQSGTDHEILVIDDGSVDETAEVVGRVNAPIRYQCLPHSGLPGLVRNTGIRASRGTYVAFLDADDLWTGDALERRFAYLQRHQEVAMVHANFQLFDHVTGIDYPPAPEALLPPSGWIGPRLIHRNHVHTSTVMVRREVFDAVGLFQEDPLRKWGEDWDLWLRIAARYQVGWIAEPLARIRVHAGSLTYQEDELISLRNHLEVIERACAFAPDVYEPERQSAVSFQFHIAWLSTFHLHAVGSRNGRCKL